MANPSRQKGTGGEGEVCARLEVIYGPEGVRRNPAASKTDIRVVGLGPSDGRGVSVLYTRPDRGEWLVTLRASDFEDLLWGGSPSLNVEVKRYKAFSIHSIFEEKFGKSERRKV